MAEEDHRGDGQSRHAIEEFLDRLAKAVVEHLVTYESHLATNFWSDCRGSCSSSVTTSRIKPLELTERAEALPK